LERAGVARVPHQGPLAFADAISRRRPDLANEMRPLVMRYADLRYGREHEASYAAEVRDFERKVSRLKVAARA